MNDLLSIYLLPPVLSLVSGLYLAFLALARGTIRRENRSFALVCIWCSLLAPVFIAYQLIDDPDRILTLERVVHFFYVYLPVFLVTFFHHILDIQNKNVVRAVCALSFLISLTTPTSYYIHGFHRFTWGYVAKGGPAFQLFSLYGAAVFLYCLFCFTRRLKVETNPFLRLKFKYVLISFGLLGLLTLMNIPAMHGIDIYPAGNFIFLPMGTMAYGVLRYRLLEVRSFLHVVSTRALIGLLVVLPNGVVFVYYANKVGTIPPFVHFCLLAVWFGANCIYIRWMRELFGRYFHKMRQTLKETEALLNKQLLVLRHIDDLSGHLREVIRAILPCPWAHVYVYDEAERQLDTPGKRPVALPDDLARHLFAYKGIIEVQSLGLLPYRAHWAAPLEDLLREMNAACAVPLVHDSVLVGILVLPEKENHKPLTPDEATFILSISTALAPALANAIMYQRVSTLKDILQARTEALSREIDDRRRAEHKLQTVQMALQDANLEMEKAILQANELTVRAEINNHVLTREIEDRQRIEAALRQSEETYRLIAENATDVIWTIDLQGRFTFISPAIMHLLGYSPSELTAQNITMVLTAESLAHATRLIAVEMERLRSSEGKHRKSLATPIEQVRKDGTTVWTEVNTRFISDVDRKIIGILGVTRDITERKKAEQELIFMAHHDALTGLHNRKALVEFLETEIQHAHSTPNRIVLLFFDLNKFKLVNDTYGHEIGDRLLSKIAQRLKKAVRESDFVARLGGDEFTIILKNPPDHLPDKIVRRIATDLAVPFDFGTQRIDFVSASIGMATFPDDGTTAGELMRNADKAMYDAKKTLNGERAAINLIAACAHRDERA